jgi:HAD superfamily phosphatase
MLVFDMDGVLVDVTESYRETVVQAVRALSGKTIDRELIQEYKNQGGWNNDWALTQRILADFGRVVDYDTVVVEFNKLFLGHNGVEGLINREKWIARSGLLESLAAKAQLAIFSGRMRYEADITLERYTPAGMFHPIVCADDVERGKPDPDGLNRIMRQFPGKRLLYFGDVVDDARAAKAAGVPFIGVVASDHLQRTETVDLLQQEGAIAIIDDINQLATDSGLLAGAA